MLDAKIKPHVRRGCPLQLAADLVNGKPEGHVDSSRFKDQAWDRLGVTARDRRQDVLALSGQRLVRITGSTFGHPYTLSRPLGVEAAQEFQIDQRRAAKRFQAACNDLLDWLYVESAAKSSGIENYNFLAESIGHLGLKYSEAEVREALSWLTDEGFTAEGAEPSLRALTRQGFAFEFGMSVHEYLTATRTGQATSLIRCGELD